MLLAAWLVALPAAIIALVAALLMLLLHGRMRLWAWLFAGVVTALLGATLWEWVTG